MIERRHMVEIIRRSVFLRECDAMGDTEIERNHAARGDYCLCDALTLEIVAIIRSDGIFDQDGNFFLEE